MKPRMHVTVWTVFWLLVGPAGADELFPTEMVRFKAAENNPVFKGRGEGHWDLRIRERGWIMREGETYHLWYTGYDGSRTGLRMLGYATSTDGVQWKRHSDAPLDNQHWIEDMSIVKRGDTYYMFAEGFQDQPHLFTSQDAVNWRRVGQLDVRLANGDPIEEGPYGTPTIWVEDGTWYLFYERRDLGIWLATSKDRKVWKNVQDEPVITPGPSSYDEHLVAMNQIVKHNGRYYAYYHGSSTNKPGLWSTNVATSKDLIHWEKYGENPLFPLEENKSSGILVHDGQQYRMYTMHPEVHLHLPE